MNYHKIISSTVFNTLIHQISDNELIFDEDIIVRLCATYHNVENLPILINLYLKGNVGAGNVISGMYRGINPCQQNKKNRYHSCMSTKTWMKIVRYVSKFEIYLGDYFKHFVKLNGFYIGTNEKYGIAAVQSGGKWFNSRFNIA